MRISSSTVAGQKNLSTAQLSEFIPYRDYTRLNRSTYQLRLWIPEPAKQALDEVCQVHEVSMTVYLTEFFATYLFGHHEMLRMRANNAGLYELEPFVKYNLESVRQPAVPNLGKNIFALKILIPEKIKDGLRFFAERAGVTLGEFSRALICAHLFGRDYGPKKLMANASINISVAKDWEAGIEDDQHL